MQTAFCLRVLPYKKNSAAFNMAADEYLLNQENGVNLRFYGWEQKTLSLGNSQKKINDVNLAFCQKHLGLVRRLSGGQAVLHESELTYSITANNHLFGSSILKTYSAISQIIQKSLQALGVKSTFQPRTSGVKRCGICFYEPAAYELLVEGKKIVGSAQLRRKNRFLQHGSILWSVDFPLWANVWKNTGEQDLKNRVGCLEPYLPKDTDMQRLASTMTQNLAAELALPIQELGFSSAEQQQIEGLMQNYQLSWPNVQTTSNKPSSNKPSSNFQHIA